MSENIIVDRYTGCMEPPDVDTMCMGQCEGTGFVPIYENETEEPWRSLWLEAENKTHSEDGWHFIKCPDCSGTGRRTTC